MTEVLIGLGSNLGDRRCLLSQAIGEIGRIPHTSVIDYSHAYETVPWGVEDQPEFLNAVALARTDLRADQLLEALLDVEDRLGRTHELRYGPRTIDLDILLFGDEEWDTETLTIPHPRMAERDFVITPLLEVAPDARWPEGTPVTLDAVRLGEVLRDAGPIPDPGVGAGTPLSEDEWESVAEGRTVPPDMALRFRQLVLEQAGIPHAWDPYPPDQEFEPFGFPIVTRLKVPAEFAARARTLIAQAEAAPGFEDEADDPPDE